MDDVYVQDFQRSVARVALANRFAAFEMSLEAATVQGDLGQQFVSGLTTLGPVAESDLPGIALIPWQAFLQRCLGVDALTAEAIATCREKISALNQPQLLSLVDIVAEVTGLVADTAKAAKQQTAVDQTEIDFAEQAGRHRW